MVKKTKNQIEYDSHRKIYERILLQSRREFCLSCRIEKAANEKRLSKNAYILNAVEYALSLDGYGRDMLDTGKQSSSAQDTPDPEE